MTLFRWQRLQELEQDLRQGSPQLPNFLDKLVELGEGI